ncbi:unknown [Firmicutes bacterium CAG:137]|nr:unknown [Firmicutes bacterium CAG:137]
MIVVRVRNVGFDLALNGDFAGIIGHAAVCGGGSGVLPDYVSTGLGDEYAGSFLIVTSQDHIDGARLVVIDYSGDGAHVHSYVGLICEVGLTTGDKDNLTGDVDARIVFLKSDGIQEYIVVLRAFSGGVQGGHGIVPAGASLASTITIAEGAAPYLKRGTHRPIVVHRCHSKRIGVSTGGTGCLEIHILNVQIGHGACGVRGPVTAVAGSHGHHAVCFSQVVQQVLIVLTGGEAGGGGTQRQVHRVTAQDDGVFDGGHVVRIVSAAHLAEDFHGENLGVGCIAHSANCVGSGDITGSLFDEPVGSGNASHMGAMLRGGVVVVGDIQIQIQVVIGKGSLQIEVQILCRQLGVPLCHIQLGQLFRKLIFVQHIHMSQIFLVAHTGQLGVFGQSVDQRAGIEGLMVRIQTGVDDGDPGAGAGIAGFPYLDSAGHVSGDQHIGLVNSAGGGGLGLIPGLQNHLSDAGNPGDGGKLTIFHIGGNDVRSQGQVPGYIQFFAGGLFDPGGDGSLVLLQARPVGHG